jgi:hypothetical protein
MHKASDNTQVKTVDSKPMCDATFLMEELDTYIAPEDKENISRWKETLTNIRIQSNRLYQENRTVKAYALDKNVEIHRTCVICKAKCTTICSKCKTVYYCGKEHQLQDWPKHKVICELMHDETNVPMASRNEIRDNLKYGFFDITISGMLHANGRLLPLLEELTPGEVITLREQYRKFNERIIAHQNAESRDECYARVTSTLTKSDYNEMNAATTIREFLAKRLLTDDTLVVFN